MKRQVFDCQPGCPVESTLQIISSKWKSVILYHLLQEKVCHFGSLQRQLVNCSRRMLALQLKELEQDQIIEKITYQDQPFKTEYRLTLHGQTLKPVILAMAVWGEKYNRLQKNK